MSRYRTVDVRLWHDRRFLALSDDGKLLWLFFLTCPQRLAIPGVIVGGEFSLAEQLGWEVERYRKGYAELLAKGLRVRAEGRVVWLTNALKYQKVAGPKAMKGMAKAWDDVPEGALKAAIWEELKIACKSWSVLFAKLFTKVHGEGYAQLHLDGVSDGVPPQGSGTRTGTRPRPGDSEESPPSGATPPTPPEVVLKVVRPLPPEAEAAARRLMDKVIENLPTGTLAKLPDSTKRDRALKWADSMRLLHERDGHSWDEINSMIDWCQQDGFWKSNILSGEKLREKWDQLAARRASVRPQQRGESGLDVAMRIAEGG